MTDVRYRIAVASGDGIGPEVTAAAKRVLEATAERFGYAFDWDEVLAGGAAIDAHGAAIRDEDVARCAEADAVLLGAVGGPRWDDPSASVRPEQALFALRKGLGLFANLRPISVEPALFDSSPLRPGRLRGVDLIIVRELTGGLYFGDRTEAKVGGADRKAVDSLPYTEAEIKRIVRLAFTLARGRRGRVTSVDKANVLATSRLWRTVATEVASEFRGVVLEHRLVDSCAMELISHPAAFDVIVTENLFGDILSDEASVLAGSMGMLPSASLGERRTSHGTFGMYEPVHGSAPDIAGTGLANPLGSILSAALLLRWSLGRADAAGAIERAVRATLAGGHRTADLLPPDSDKRADSTMEMTDAIVGHIAGTAHVAGTAGTGGTAGAGGAGGTP
ncbi:MAG: 3-isopropylmalate dehydrogenase [Candidatus Limnocylindrales bacterium]